MLKNPFQTAITFAVVSLLVKLLVFSMGLQHGAMEKYIFFIYMLILLIAVFISVRTNKINAEGNTAFIEDFKVGARTASFYAILMGIITYAYYSGIDSDFFAIKQEVYIEGLNKTAKEKILTNPEGKEKILEELKGNLETMETFLSPYFHSMWTLFGLVFIGVFNSLVLTLLMRKLPGFKK